MVASSPDRDPWGHAGEILSYELVYGEKLISWPRSEEEAAEEERELRSGWRMKRSKESHELPQGLTPRPYQPGSSTVLFIALNRAPTVRGRAIVPPREPIVSYTSLLRLDRSAAP